MNQQQRAVVQQALEAFAVLKMNDYSGYECTKHETDKIDDAETALRQLLEQPEPEPVAWMHKQGNHEEPSFRQLDDWEIQNGWEQYPLYTTPPAQPEPVQQKPLFADIIAQHPGLAEELKAMDAAPVQEPSLLATLKAVQGTLIAANEQGKIADTIWFSEYETLFDFIGAEIDKAEQAPPPAQPDGDKLSPTDAQPADHFEQHLDMVDHGDELTIAYLDGVHTGKQLAKREWVGLTDEEREALILEPDGSAEANVKRVEVLPGAWGKEYDEVDAWSKPLILQMLSDHEAKLREKNGGA